MCNFQWSIYTVTVGRQDDNVRRSTEESFKRFAISVPGNVLSNQQENIKK